MPGTLGRYYEEQGGKVLIMGKPDPKIYTLALNDLDMEAKDVIAVGDSVEHDVAGAHEHGIDSLFIAGGIHAQEFRDSEGGVVVTESRVQQLAREGLFCSTGPPTYCMNYLQW